MTKQEILTYHTNSGLVIETIIEGSIRLLVFENEDDRKNWHLYNWFKESNTTKWFVFAGIIIGTFLFYGNPVIAVISASVGGFVGLVGAMSVDEVFSRQQTNLKSRYFETTVHGRIDSSLAKDYGVYRAIYLTGEVQDKIALSIARRLDSISTMSRASGSGPSFFIGALADANIATATIDGLDSCSQQEAAIRIDLAMSYLGGNQDSWK